MRIGNLEISGGLLVMPAFALVIAVLVLWSWYYYAAQTKEMKALAASRGWRFLGKDRSDLRAFLEEMETDTYVTWRPNNIILTGDSPNTVCLFNYQVDRGTGKTGSSGFGTGCLVERPGGRARGLVTIDRRPRLFSGEWFYEDIVNVGGPEFRERFLVQSRQPDLAAATVTTGVQEVLLRQTPGLIWNRVWIAGGGVLVTVTVPLKPEEWDELIGMSKQLLAALP